MGNRMAQRIAVIGICGSGKSTLSKWLAKKVNLPLIHLDQEYWLPGWVQPEKERWLTIHQELIEREQWIIDGNFNGTLKERVDRAELVIFLDFNRFTAIGGVVKRWIAHWGRSREDMDPGCPEKIDFPFIKFIWNFHRSSRPGILTALKENPQKQVICLKSRKEVNCFQKQFSLKTDQDARKREKRAEN